MRAFTEKYADKIHGVISCFDRVVITGTILDICYADGMSRHLRSNNIRIFDYTKFAEPLREEIRENAEKVARDNRLEIEFIRRKDFRKEERIKGDRRTQRVSSRVGAYLLCHGAVSVV